MLIKVENLNFSYSSSDASLFDNANFQFDTNWKIGLIGRNGRGKTTFFKILLGKLAYEGKISPSLKYDYFPYEVANKDQKVEKIMEEIAPNSEGWEFNRELSLLDLDDDILDKNFSVLSNGEQTKVLLAALFLNEDNFLLIDEPTNHLDQKGRENVAKYLRNKKGFILVSHDRSFLDVSIDHIISINKSGIEIQSGNFSSWYDNFNNRQNFEMNENEKIKKEIKRLEVAKQRTSNWSNKTESSKIGQHVPDRGFIGHKAAKMMQRSKNIEKRQNDNIEKKKGLLKDLEEYENLNLYPIDYFKENLLRLEDIGISYNAKAICKGVSFELNQGDRLVLKGKNGCGKSSVIKLILGQDIKYSGELYMGNNLIISYLPQDTSSVSGSLKKYILENNIDEPRFKSILRKLDFKREMFEYDLASLSEGQKKKVALARSLCSNAHLYIWDEPLNYLDIYSRIQIENLILEYNPTMILVEHDKTFCDNVATKICEM